MARHSDSIRLLLAKGPMLARQVVENTGLSQPTVSRALVALGDEIVRIGSGAAIRYALRDSARGFEVAPIFRVSDEGQVQALGTLIPVRPEGFVMVQADGAALHSDGLPWWLFDMRPQGYLGRAYASAHAAGLGLPPNPEHWRDADVIRALLAHGHDAIGNLLIGERARDRFIAMPAPVPVDRSIDYPALARAAGAGELAGSSAGGEQPKFCAYTERGHVLVKFTAPDDNPVSERWRDLLLAEHLALSVLGIATEVFDFGPQRFLEVPRFDRIGPLGRLGLFSLRALDAEFVGDVAALLWAFGTLIGNTDMHAGNLSFISRLGCPYQLAPAYDMLPMAFAPSRSGALVDTLPPAFLSSSVDAGVWHEALRRAERFHALLGDCRGFSGRFLPCIGAIRGPIDEAGGRIGRLG